MTMNLKTLRKQAKNESKARPIKDDAPAARMAQEAARLAANAAMMGAADLYNAKMAATQHDLSPQVSALLEALQHTITVQTATIFDMMEKQGKRLEAAMSRPIQVEAGDVEVNLPERPSSFTCEFDDGRTATLTPNFESVH